MTNHKTLYVNGRFLSHKQTGVERYAYAMCHMLTALGADIHIICPKKAEIDASYDVSSFHIIRYGRGRSHVWEQLVLPFFFVGKRNYILLSFTGLGSIFVPSKVMTIHDVSFLVEPSWFSKAYYFYYKVMTPLAARTSKQIITVSKASKQEICRFYPFIQADRVSVIYSAANPQTFSKQEADVQTDSSAAPYILSVSSIDPRKNFQRLLEAAQGQNDITVKIVGGKNKVFQAAGLSGKQASRVEFLGRVSDEELCELYNHATAFIFPSLYEGFGLPPIEAMSLGCPVLASDIPVIHEVCGDAAIYFNPTDTDDIRRALRKALFMPKEEREKMVNRGYENAKRFNWNKSAKRLLEVLEQL